MTDQLTDHIHRPDPEARTCRWSASV